MQLFSKMDERTGSGRQVEDGLMHRYSVALLLTLMLVSMPVLAEYLEEGAEIPAGKKALEIELPEQSFGGTPLIYWTLTLEEKDFRPRKPFLAPEGVMNLAKGKPVSSSKSPLVGKLSQITDGDKNFRKTSLVELNSGVQWVQIDLEKPSEIHAILLWHFHEYDQVYFDTIVQVSNDKEFKKDVTTVYNNDYDNSSKMGVGKDKEYIESYKGRLIDAGGIKGRYVRCYSNGNTASDMNHYIEVEVWGKQ